MARRISSRTGSLSGWARRHLSRFTSPSPFSPPVGQALSQAWQLSHSGEKPSACPGGSNGSGALVSTH